MITTTTETNRMQRNREYIPDKSIFNPIKGKALFYPASANDVYSCIRIFSPFIREFWFLDYEYFRRVKEPVKPLLRRIPRYEFLSSRIDGQLNAQMEERWDKENNRLYRYIEPCTAIERYSHKNSQNMFTVFRKREFAEWSFNNDKRDLGVFYYRGDSGDGGDGGSGITWFDNKRIRNITDKLCDGGLIVTDGSNKGRSKSDYSEIWKNVWRDYDYDPKEILDTYKPFTDSRGVKFTPVGYAGYRYGPVIIWQVRKK